MIQYKNPIMPGFYPDPSICRVGNDYYMVHSTFAYFPGIPVFHSENLGQWEQVGNALERKTQLYLEGCGHSDGIYAPTLRWHEGVFYLIVTNVSGGGNFIVTASDPAGPWSEPHFLGDAAAGIDPSLFFDEDGACYYIGQRNNSAGSRYFGDCEIWIQRLNLETFRLEGEDRAVLYGFQKNAVWPEGPHLYKKDGYYYVLHAEGGTADNHAVMIARSRDIWGPYEYAPTNPVLTHRHLGKESAVTCVGHGDMTEDGNGNWYMVLLACRPEEGHSLMGRETFLAELQWENDWPVVNPGFGMLKSEGCIPGEEMDGEEKSRVYHFNEGMGSALPPEFMMLRNPCEKVLALPEKERGLRLYMQPPSLADKASPAYVALRQRHRHYQAETQMVYQGENSTDCAGLAVMQSNENHLRFECYEEKGRRSLRVVKCEKGQEETLAGGFSVSTGKLCIGVETCGLKMDFYQKEGTECRLVLGSVDLRFLSTESAGGFVGCTVGMYASGNGGESGGYADFEWFSYVEPEK